MAASAQSSSSTSDVSLPDNRFELEVSK